MSNQDEQGPLAPSEKPRPRLLHRKPREKSPVVGETVSVAVQPLNPITGTPGDPLRGHYDPQEIAERAAQTGPRVEVTGDEWERHLIRQIAAADADELAEPNQFDVEAARWRASDPSGNGYREFETRYVNPDYVERGIGWRGWQPVEDPDTKGQVTVAKQILTKMPKEKSLRRRYARAKMAQERINSSQEAYQERTAKAARDSGGAVVPHDAQKWVFGDSR